MNADFIQLQKIEDPRGDLVVLEFGAEIPFVVRRSYFFYDLRKDIPRGFHAHKKLQQIFVCVRGGCEICIDDGKERKTVKLEQPDHALYIGPMIWRELRNFTKDCLFVCYASDPYDEDDYIRDYDEFRRLSGNV